MSALEDRWDQVRAVFESARALPPPERAAYLAACVDAELRAEVEALLHADGALQAGAARGFLELDPRRTAALLESTEEAGEPAEPLSPGERVGRYRVLRRLGSGGMGVVYLAEDVRLRRPAALKLLPPHLAVDAAARHRFENEARAASALDHPNIVTVYGMDDTADGRAFLAMALCDGEGLHELLARGPVPVGTALALATQIADGLAAAHRRGIVHRDIKPRNIVVTPEGSARIVDFGIARTGDGTIADAAATPGTLAYMSPEQTRGEAGDARTDVWALGTLLYEMLVGRRPFAGADPPALIDAIRSAAPRRANELRHDVPEGLARIVDRCLAKQPSERYDDAGAVHAALRALSAPKHPGVRVAGLAAALLVLTGAVLIGWPRASAAPLEPRRVAVAAIENRSGTPQLDVHARMATDWITHGLLETGVIEVVSLDAFAADSPAVAAGTLARDAGARLLLTGAIYGSGDQLRLQAQVADAASGRIVAAVQPVRTTADAIMEAVEQLRRRVQEALYPQLDTQLTHVRAFQRAPRFDAYSAYLAGREAHARRELPVALAHFRRAAALDTSFMLPHVISAVVLNMMGDRAAADSTARALQQVPERLDRFSLAHLEWLRAGIAGDKRAAHAAMALAARLAPGSTLPGVQAADEALGLGRAREAVERLSAIEPERGELRGWLPYWQTLTTAHHARGSHRQELAVAERARRIHPDDPRARMLELRALAALGRIADLERALPAARSRPPRGEPGPGTLVLQSALELRAHAAGRGAAARRAAADRLLAQAIAWYRSVPGAQRTLRQQYELAMALAAAGQSSAARSVLEALLANPPAGRAGPSPFASARTPNFPDAVAFHGARGVLAALDGDTATARADRVWLEQFRGPYPRGRPTYWRGAITAALGDRETAVALVRRAFAEGLPFHTALHTAPELESLRGYAPFQRLVQPRD